jgi:hypothetical protein
MGILHCREGVSGGLTIDVTRQAFGGVLQYLWAFMVTKTSTAV